MKKQTNITEKPYNRCLACAHRSEKRCDGPRTSAMELARWCEFMRDMKEANGLTNVEISKKADVSLKTIERLLALSYDKDILRDTARRIEDAIIGSSNQYPCYLAFEAEHPQEQSEQLNDAMRELERALADNKDYRDVLDNIHASYRAEMQTLRNEAQIQVQFVKEEAQKKIDYLRNQVDRLQKDNDNLWAENNRKAALVDEFWRKQKIRVED